MSINNLEGCTYTTKVNSLLVFILLVGFCMVSYSFKLLQDPLFWLIFSGLATAFLWILGVSYEVHDNKLVICRFSRIIKSIDIYELSYLCLLDRQFALLIYKRIPLFFWGVKSVDQKELLLQINSKLKYKADFDIVLSNRKLLVEIIQNVVISIVLFISAWKVDDVNESGLQAWILLVACFLLLISLWKLKKIQIVK